MIGTEQHDAAGLAPAVPPDFMWQSLHGALAPFALGADRAAVMHPDVGVFGALADQTDPEAWAQLADLLGPGREIAIAPLNVDVPRGWTEALRLDGVQMAGDDVVGHRGSEVVDLGPDDLPELLDLVERTKPGPFRARTIELGGYVGVRVDGRLVAAAGRRLATAEHVEVSAVCVDPGHRRRGLARVVVDAVVAGIRAEDRRPLLHAAADNTGAIALYEAMGFTISARFAFVGVVTPGDAGSSPDQS